MSAMAAPPDNGEDAAKAWIAQLISEAWDGFVEWIKTPQGGGIAVGLLVGAIVIYLLLRK